MKFIGGRMWVRESGSFWYRESENIDLEKVVNIICASSFKGWELNLTLVGTLTLPSEPTFSFEGTTESINLSYLLFMGTRSRQISCLVHISANWWAPAFGKRTWWCCFLAQALNPLHFSTIIIIILFPIGITIIIIVTKIIIIILYPIGISGRNNLFWESTWPWQGNPVFLLLDWLNTQCARCNIYIRIQCILHN